MVKGVNKTVIEINDTGSRMFEKIVFYVAPEYGNLNANHLKRAAGDLAREMDIPAGESLRARVRRKQRIKVMSVLSAAIIALVVALVILL